jgi:hypothetical protein
MIETHWFKLIRTERTIPILSKGVFIWANRETDLSEICMAFVNAYKIQFVLICETSQPGWVRSQGKISLCEISVKWNKIFHIDPLHMTSQRRWRCIWRTN